MSGAHATIKHRQHQQVQRGGRDQPAEDHQGHRPLDLAARLAAAQAIGNSPSPSPAPSSAPAPAAPAPRGTPTPAPRPPPRLAQVLPVRHHHDAVAQGDAEQRHEADQRPHVEDAARQVV